MKRRDFERILRDKGFSLVRESGHSVWGKGAKHIAIPHGKEINRMVVRRLLKEVEQAA